MGVDVFFVLSGMLMSIILFEKRMSLRDFYIRRFSRIYPVFLVCVLLMYAVGAVLSKEFSLWEVISSLTFLRTYTPADPHIWSSGPTVGHFWSLNVEEHAYVFLSVVTLFFINRRFIAVGLLVLGLLLVALSFYRYANLSETEFRLYLIRTECSIVFILFSAGYGLLARQYKISVPSAIPVVCVILAFVCYSDATPIWLLFSACPILLAVTVNHLKDMPTLITGIFSNSVVRHFGLWSYSIYLWQQIFYEYSWAFPGEKFSALLLSVATGIASYYLLEQPARRVINKRWAMQPRYRHSDAVQLPK